MAIGILPLPQSYKDTINHYTNKVNNAMENAKQTITTTTKNLVVDPVKKALKDTGITGPAIGATTSAIEANKQNVPTGKAITKSVSNAVKGGVVEVAIRTSYNMLESYYSPDGAQRKYINGQQ